jgi:MFS family permease
MRGRVMSLWAVAFLGSTPIGGPLDGYVAQHAGARWGLGIGALACMVAAAIAVATVRRGRARRARTATDPATGEPLFPEAASGAQPAGDAAADLAATAPASR